MSAGIGFLILWLSAARGVSDVRVIGNDGPGAGCTLFASPTGKETNSGVSKEAPKTFAGAAQATRPGSVVCLLPGTSSLSSSFAPPHSGTPDTWIVYRNYDERAVEFVWTGPADASPMFKMAGGNFPSNPAYLEFRGLHLDGKGKALDGFFCMGSHHLRFVDNSIKNTGGAGIASVTCDYLTLDHNTVEHNGYMPAAAGKNARFYSWTSGISLNSNQWFDSRAGFHNIITGNVVTGEVDQSSHHSDGNGIILDLSNRTYKPKSADTPPVLVVNNVVYGNGGRCLEAYTVTNFWFVNNTCYKNNLDRSIGKAASITINNSHSGYVINNIAAVWSGVDLCFAEVNAVANIRYASNLCSGNPAGARHPNSAEIFHDDPLFLHPPYFHPNAARQYAKALAPSMLGDGLTLQPRSPAIGKGIDPSTLFQLPPEIIEDLKKYVYTDIQGRARGGKAFDLGAYQSSVAP